MKTLFKTAAAAGLALSVWAGAAEAAVNVDINPNGVFVNTIEVISEDGQSYTKIVNKDLKFSASLSMSITKGKLVTYRIKQNAEVVYSHGEYENGPSSHTATHLVTASTAHLGLTAWSILSACNGNITTMAGQQPQTTETAMVPLTLEVQFKIPAAVSENEILYPEYEDTGLFPVQVICKPFSKSPDGIAGTTGGTDAPAPVSIIDADLFLTTFTPTAQSSEMGFAKCKKLMTTVRFETNKAGLVTFDLHRLPGGKTTHSAWAMPEGDKFYARYHKYDTFSQTTSVQYMAQSTSPLGGNTDWKGMTIHCNGGLTTGPAGTPPDPEGPGLTADVKPVPPVPPAPPRRFVSDDGNPGTQRELMIMITPKFVREPGNQPGGNNRRPNEVKDRKPNGGGSVRPGQGVVLTFVPRIDRTPKRPSGPGSLTHITCQNGKIKLGKCYCEHSLTKVKLSRHAYKCVARKGLKTFGKKRFGPASTRPNRKRLMKTARPAPAGKPPVTPGKKPNKPGIVCKGGLGYKGDCLCRPPLKKTKVAKGVYQCKRPAATRSRAKRTNGPPRRDAVKRTNGSKPRRVARPRRNTAPKRTNPPRRVNKRRLPRQGATQRQMRQRTVAPRRQVRKSVRKSRRLR